MCLEAEICTIRIYRLEEEYAAEIPITQAIVPHIQLPAEKDTIRQAEYGWPLRLS